MIAMEIETGAEFKTKPIVKAVEKGEFESLGHIGGSIRLDVIASIKKSPGPSAPGTPVHTHKDIPKSAKRSVFYSADKELEEVVIGFLGSKIGPIMGTHERGGIFKGTSYPARPTVGPALERAIPRIGPEFKDSLGAYF